MNNYLVYKHTTPDGKVYIGMTGRAPEKRWLNGGGYYKSDFAEAIHFFGWENVKHEILASGLTREEAWLEECNQIKAHKSNDPRFGYNKSSGGRGPSTGTKRTEEWKRIIKESRMGIYDSGEVGRKISASKKGKTNGLQGRIGKQCTHAGLVYQIDETTSKVIDVFHGYDEMHRITGFAKTPVKETVSGKRKRAYGYLWKYERGQRHVAI